MKTIIHAYGLKIDIIDISMTISLTFVGALTLGLLYGTPGYRIGLALGVLCSLPFLLDHTCLTTTP